MQIFTAFFKHVLMACTFRHRFCGLPRIETMPLFLIFAVAGLAAWFRWGGFGFFFGMYVLLLFMTLVTSPRFAAVYALLSIGIDLTAVMLFNVADIDIRHTTYSVWEYSALAFYFYIDHKKPVNQVV